MSPDQEPLRRSAMPAGRWAAVGAAAAVTALTLAGAVGFGPGAAMGQVQPSAQAKDVSVRPPAQQTNTDGASSGGTTIRDDWLTIDDDPKTDESAQTALPKHSGTGKRVVYDISAQRVWLVSEPGKVERTYLVSGGKDEELLQPGRYAVYSMSRNAISYNHRATMNYMVRFTTGDHAPIGFHDVPAHADGSLAQSRDQLGTPLSSGCIRQWISDARALWEFAHVDTSVVVTA